MKHITLSFWGGLIIFFLCISTLHAQNSTALFRTLIPTPQHIVSVAEELGVDPQTIVGFCLKKKAGIPFGQYYFPNTLFSNHDDKVILLELSKEIEHREGYKLSVRNGKISIKAKTQAGLLYGLQTLIQLSRNAVELNLAIPACEIEDQPNSDYRSIHIDLKHHLDKKKYMYQVLQRMASYKLNAVVIEFEDKIRYEKYPLIAAGNAPTVEEWKEWSEYAHKLNIEVSPLIQGIGHADFILKHEVYKPLREDAKSDWVCCPSNEEYYTLQLSLYEDAIRATPHGKYLHLGGDEVGTLGVCDVCKPQNKTALEHQMKWLKRVSDFAVKHGRTPIFWDDMVFHQAGLYWVITDAEKPERMDSLWEARLPELNKQIKLFPKEVVYMRWQYGNANLKGNKLALKWFNDHGLSVMGATAAQTTSAMFPVGNGRVDIIKSFQLAHQETPVQGVLCTAWDDSSPLFETFWKGFIAHAQYSWNMAIPMDGSEFDYCYRVCEFGNAVVQVPDFRKLLDQTYYLWEIGLLNEGSRVAMWKTKGKYTTIPLPGEERGVWSKIYAERIERAEKGVALHQEIQQLILKNRLQAIRNDYSLQVFERINDLTGYTSRLLLALSAYDIARDSSNLNKLRSCVDEFKMVRENMEQVYAQTRCLNQPEGYILPMNHHNHLAIRTANTDWMFFVEVDLIKQIDTYLDAR